MGWWWILKSYLYLRDLSTFMLVLGMFRKRKLVISFSFSRVEIFWSSGNVLVSRISVKRLQSCGSFVRSLRSWHTMVTARRSRRFRSLSICILISAGRVRKLAFGSISFQIFLAWCVCGLQMADEFVSCWFWTNNFFLKSSSSVREESSGTEGWWQGTEVV